MQSKIHSPKIGGERRCAVLSAPGLHTGEGQLTPLPCAVTILRAPKPFEFEVSQVVAVAQLALLHFETWLRSLYILSAFVFKMGGRGKTVAKAKPEPKLPARGPKKTAKQQPSISPWLDAENEAAVATSGQVFNCFLDSLYK